MWLLHSINKHLDATAIAPSRFGRDAVGDPNFVRDLKRGREPKAETVARVRAYLAAAATGTR